MNNMNKTLYSLTVASLLAMGACSSEDVLNGGNAYETGHPVQLTLTVNRGDTSTRTVLSENEATGGLNSDWVEDDVLYVYSKDGNKLGSLKIKSGWDTPVGVFSGTIDGVKDGQFVNLLYYNLIEGMVSEENDAQTKYLKIDLSEQSFSSVADLSKLDILSGANPNDEAITNLATVQLSVKDDNTATVMRDVKLKSKLAFARFTLKGLDEGSKGTLYITDVNDKLYVKHGVEFGSGDRVNDYTSSEGMKISNVEADKDVYVAFVPNYSSDVANYTFKFKFVNDGEGKDGKVYTYQFTSPTKIEAGKYYNTFTESTSSISGVEIEMEAEKTEKPKGDDDLTGPVVSIGDKKYRFVKGNLYYDMNDQSWHLYEKETYYRTLAGTSSPYAKQINSDAYNASTNHEIDLFAWGATGLGVTGVGQDLGRAKTPDLIRQGWSGETSWAGCNWPCYNTNTMSTEGNAWITDLWNTYGYDDPVYDFGYAYMNNGCPSNDKRQFVTAPLAAYSDLLNPEKNFAQGCIIKGAGITGGDAQGVLILFGITDVEEAKNKIQSIEGGKAPKLTKLLDTDKANRGFDFLIELPNYESIEELGAMFFALGGSSNWSSKQQKSTDCGAYWTKDGAKGSATDANGYCFFFRKSKTASECNYIVGRNGVSVTRRTQNSVRLMVEVSENADGTVGPVYRK